MSDERAVTEVDLRIGQRMRAQRLERSMSQEQLAELLGITFQQVQKYEKGTNRIAASRLHNISLALDVPVMHFFEGMGERPASANGRTAVEATLATAEGVALLRLFAEIKSVKLRRRVLEMIRILGQA